MSIEPKLCEVNIFQLLYISNVIRFIDQRFAFQNSRISCLALIFNLKNLSMTVQYAKNSVAGGEIRRVIYRFFRAVDMNQWLNGEGKQQVVWRLGFDSWWVLKRAAALQSFCVALSQSLTCALFRDCTTSELTDHQVSGFVYSWFLENTEKTKASLETFLRLMPQTACCWPCWSSGNHSPRLFQKTIEGFDCKINGHWPSSWGSAPAQLGLVRQASSTNTGCFQVGGSRCWQRQACLRKTCYYSWDGDSVQESKVFYCFVVIGQRQTNFFSTWNEIFDGIGERM